MAQRYRGLSYDQYFTPSTLAEELVGFVTLENVATVADFAAGDGELLRAAAGRWNGVKLTATDVDPGVVGSLKRRYPGWSVSRCDFTNSRSRARADALRGREASFDVVVLNPPFSQRGGTRFATVIEGVTYESGPAFSFILQSLRYLRPGGQLVAIIPYGALHSEKDEVARGAVSARYGLDVVRTCERGTFRAGTPRTAVVRVGLGPELTGEALPPPQGRVETAFEVSLQRGSLPVHRSVAEEGVLPLVHTTELREGAVTVGSLWAPQGSRSIVGPAVLIPRVGKPLRKKLALLERSRGPVALSDCVLAVECSEEGLAERVLRALHRRWETVERAYGGTCARYITLKALSQLLVEAGFRVLPYGDSVRAGTPPHPTPPSASEVSLRSRSPEWSKTGDRSSVDVQPV